MKNLYLRFNDRKYVKFTEKIIICIKKILGQISIEKISVNKYKDTNIILIPKYKNYNLYIKYRIVNHIKRYISLNKIDNILVDKNLQFLFKDFEQNNILCGKYLMKNLILGIIEYICNINKINTQLENIHIFVNQYSKDNIKIIENMCKKFKTVNIITENLKYYKRLENKLFDEGVLITVSNNKRKSAKNAKFIVNIDFEKNKIEQYNVNMSSIIINLINEKVLFEKYFRGVLINNIKIMLNSDLKCYINEFFGEINENIYLENLLYDKECGDAQNEFLKYGCEIVGLIGIRGVINDKELQKSS